MCRIVKRVSTKCGAQCFPKIPVVSANSNNHQNETKKDLNHFMLLPYMQQLDRL